MQRPRFLLLIALAFSSLPAYAGQGYDYAKKLVTVLSQAPESVWAGLPNSNLKFIVREPTDGHAIFVNFNADELSIIAGQIKSSENKISESTILLPEIDFFAGCDQVRCGENQESKIESELTLKLSAVKLCKKPLLIVNPFLPEDWKKGFEVYGVNTDDALLFINFHEAFHSFQAPIFSQSLLPMNFPDKTSCSHDVKQKNIFKTALGKWNSFLTRSLQPSGDSITNLDNVLSFYQSNPSSCLDTSGYRPEGTANYFAFKIISSSLVIPNERLISFINSSWLNLKTLDESDCKAFDPDDRYGIGFAFYYSLSILDPTGSWQKQTNLGEPPIVTLKNLRRIH